MSKWTVAGVQMDCQLGEVAANLTAIRRNLLEAAELGARLVVFPECILTGYCFRSREEAWPHAQSIPGPACAELLADCESLGTHVVVGMLERGDQGELFNSCAILGPGGLVGSYRKIHLPFLGVDRFVTPGDRPFAVHDLGGLRIGVNICYDGSFPESARILTLLGADLVLLPTNWPSGARSTIRLTEARALENHIYYGAINRIGVERGFQFIGKSRFLSPDASILASANEDHTILIAEIDPECARAKRVITIPGEHEVDRVGHRRPEMYEMLGKQP